MPEGLPDHIRRILKLASTACGIPQYELARRIGISPQRVWRIFAGLTLPDRDTEWPAICRELQQPSLLNFFNGNGAHPEVPGVFVHDFGKAAPPAAPEPRAR